MPGGECYRHKNVLGKEMMRFRTSVINGYLVWMPAGMQMDHGSPSAHLQWFSCQNGGADIHDIIKCHEGLSCMRGREL